MKKTSIMIILTFFMLNVFGQSTDSNSPALIVERNKLTHKASFTFKPNLRMKIKTKKGVAILAKSYILLENSIVVNAHDTIALNDIRMIRGRVFGNADRKILGAGLAVASFPLLYFSALVAVYTSGSPLLATLPPVVFLIGGISLKGARRFTTANDWSFIIIHKYIREKK